jgi:hypothetical protein
MGTAPILLAWGNGVLLIVELAFLWTHLLRTSRQAKTLWGG